MHIICTLLKLTIGHSRVLLNVLLILRTYSNVNKYMKGLVLEAHEISRLWRLILISYDLDSSYDCSRNEKLWLCLTFDFVFSFRLSLKVYEVMNPNSNTLENFRRCISVERYHIPVAFFILIHIHQLMIVLNSSLNFIVYCCVAREFRFDNRWWRRQNERLHFLFLDYNFRSEVYRWCRSF